MPELDDVGSTLMRAAAELLATEGPAALTVRRIAAEAGVSTMNVYSRFGGKDGVVDRLFVEGFEKLTEAMEAAGETDDPMADLHRCGEAYRTFARENSTLYSVMFDRVVPDFVPSEAAHLIAHGSLGLLAERLQRAMDAGVLTPMDPMHAAAVVWSTCHGVTTLELHSIGPKVIDWSAVYRTAIEALLRGMRP